MNFVNESGSAQDLGIRLPKTYGNVVDDQVARPFSFIPHVHIMGVVVVAR